MIKLLRGVMLLDPDECCEIRIYPEDDGARIEVETWDDGGGERQTRVMRWTGKAAAGDLKRIGLDLQRIAARMARG